MCRYVFPNLVDVKKVRVKCIISVTILTTAVYDFCGFSDFSAFLHNKFFYIVNVEFLEFYASLKHMNWTQKIPENDQNLTALKRDKCTR